jgi:ABC-2 type transport system ATP-binding protein
LGITDHQVIKLQDVSVRYHLSIERYASFKEYMINYIKRKITYRDFWALQNINLTIEKGEVFGIIGVNGAGKTTLLKVIAHILKPSSGQVWVNGRVSPLMGVGIGFQEELTGRENIFLNGTLLGFSRKKLEHKFQEIVDFAELWDFIDAPVRTYSSGMQARLGFSVAIEVEPEILIIDEVLSVGDEGFQRKCEQRIRSIQKSGVTILVVSHNVQKVREMSDRCIWLDHGMIRSMGSSQQVTEEYRNMNK